MALTLASLGAKGAKPEDGKQRASQAGIEDKRNKLIEAIDKHIERYIDGKKSYKEEVDEAGNKTKSVVRVNAMSNPSKNNPKEVIITLKYGNKAIIEIVDGNQSIAVAKDVEKKVFEQIKDAITKGEFDAKIEQAAVEATPPTTKK